MVPSGGETGRSRLPGALLVVLVALAALGVFLSGGVNAQEGGVEVKCKAADIKTGKTGLWISYPAPVFTVGPAEVKTHAVDAATGVWFATNGTEISVSLDQGCTWKSSYTLPDPPDEIVPFPRESARIVSLEAAAGEAVATIVAPRAEGQANPLDPRASDGLVNMLIVTTDTGRRWSRLGDPKPNIGAPGPLVISPRNPARMYVTVGGIPHRTEDGGANWDPIPLKDAAGLPELDKTGFDSMAMDPDDQDIVWLNDGQAFWFTKDGGLTWARKDLLEGQGRLKGVAVNKPVGQKTRVVLGVIDDGGELTGYVVSENGGETYKVVPAEGVAGQLTGLGGNLSREDVVLTTRDKSNGARHGVYSGFPGKTKIENVDEHSLSPLFDPEVVERGKATFFHSFSRMVVNAQAPAPDNLPPSGDPPPIPPARPAQLEPQGGDVRVPPGGSTDVDYQLNLPEQPTPIDVFFLLDTSGSTDPYIKGLQDGLGELATNLDKADVAAGYGLGEYQDTGGLRYRRRVNIGPTDALKRSLAAIRTAGGEEPGYTAVHQAATGQGIEQVKAGRPVDKNQSPTWRQGTLRVVVHVADEPFSDDESGANRDQAVAALKDQRMTLIGIQVTDNPPAPGATAGCAAVLRTDDPGQAINLNNTSDNPVRALKLRCQLEDLARETGALAPDGGIDCNSDGVVDVPGGSPMVCTLKREGTAGNKVVAMAKPLTELLKNLDDIQEVRLVPEDPKVGVEVTPGGNYTKLNLKEKHLASFKTRISCTAEQAGQAFPLTLNAKAGVRVVGTARPRVVCGDPPLVPAVVPPVVPRKPARQEPEPAAPQPIAVVAPAPPPPIAPAFVPVPAVAVAPIPVTVVPAGQPPPPAQVPAQAPSTVQSTVQSPVGAAAQQKETSVTPVYVDLDEGAEANSEGPAELHSQGGELYYSAPKEPLIPVGFDWIIRLIGVGGVLGAAYVLAPGNQRKKQRARRKVRI